MPRILLSTVGVRGDLNPFIAIGKGLRSRGHDVRFAVESALRAAVVEEGFEAFPLAGDVLASLSPHLEAIVGGSTPIGAVRPIVSEWLTTALPAKVTDLVSAGEGADLLVARAANLAAPMAAEVLGIPWAQLTMTALTLPSSHASPTIMRMPPGRPARLVNRASWAAIERFTSRFADRPVSAVRRDLGLPSARRVMGRGGHSRHLTALVISPSVSPRRPDWPPYVQVTGYCFWDSPTTWAEPVELTAFLDAPGPVVAISFGSIAPFVGDTFGSLYDTAVDAVLAAGARALVIGRDHPGSDSVMAVRFAPFSSIYPRCAAAIHHGGPYTVAEALRAGIPSLAVPWGIDQFFSAGELARTCAGRVRRARRFTKAGARADVRALLDRPSYLERARGLKGRIAEEHGVECLCDRLESLIRGRTGASRL